MPHFTPNVFCLIAHFCLLSLYLHHFFWFLSYFPGKSVFQAITFGLSILVVLLECVLDPALSCGEEPGICPLVSALCPTVEGPLVFSWVKDYISQHTLQLHVPGEEPYLKGYEWFVRFCPLVLPPNLPPGK